MRLFFYPSVKFRNTLLTCVIKRFPRTSCPKCAVVSKSAVFTHDRSRMPHDPFPTAMVQDHIPTRPMDDSAEDGGR